MQWHPASQKDGSGHAGYDKQIQIFRQIKETEVHTGIFCMISGSQFTFRFGKVERATVTFCISGNQIDDESNDRRNMSLEDEPTISLSFYDFRKLHGSRQHYHCHDTHTNRKFITDNLCTASHGTDQREFVVTTPTGQQDTDNSNAGSCQQEEHAHIKVQNRRTFIKRNTSESQE